MTPKPMSANTDLLAVARTHLSASTSVEDPQIAAFYVSSARVAVTKAKDELATLERVLVARERELSAAAQPKQIALAANQ